jgi:hypothetical protein
LAIVNVDNILNRQGDLDTVPIIVGTEYNLLQGPDPLLCTWNTVCFKMEVPLMCDDFEVRSVLAIVLIRNACGYTIA